MLSTRRVSISGALPLLVLASLMVPNNPSQAGGSVCRVEVTRAEVVACTASQPVVAYNILEEGRCGLDNGLVECEINVVDAQGNVLASDYKALPDGSTSCTLVGWGDDVVLLVDPRAAFVEAVCTTCTGEVLVSAPKRVDGTATCH